MHPDIKAKLFNDIYRETCFGCGEMNNTNVSSGSLNQNKEENVPEG